MRKPAVSIASCAGATPIRSCGPTARGRMTITGEECPDQPELCAVRYGNRLGRNE